MSKQMTASQMGRKGGKASGAAKVRGDAEHYRTLAAKSIERRRMCEFCWMEHGQDSKPCGKDCGCHQAE